MSEANGTTRKGALGKLAVIAAGALGVGFAAREARDGGRPSAAGSRTIYGRDWRLHSPNRVPGERPAAGDRATPRGRLVDRHERDLGTFTSAALAGAGAIELHTFDLEHGQIFGVGASSEAEGTFAVIGGTGRYAGAKGSYLARQSLRELGGDGTAEFTLTLDDLEA
jgi:hypothetical protein